MPSSEERERGGISTFEGRNICGACGEIDGEAVSLRECSVLECRRKAEGEVRAFTTAVVGIKLPDGKEGEANGPINRAVRRNRGLKERLRNCRLSWRQIQGKNRRYERTVTGNELLLRRRTVVQSEVSGDG